MNRRLRVDVIGGALKPHPARAVPDGVSVGGLRLEEFNGLETGTDAAYFIVQIARDVAIGLFAHWLYEHIKQYHPKRIRIEREEVVLNRGEIERVVREKLDVRE